MLDVQLKVFNTIFLCSIEIECNKLKWHICRLSTMEKKHHVCNSFLTDS